MAFWDSEGQSGLLGKIQSVRMSLLDLSGHLACLGKASFASFLDSHLPFHQADLEVAKASCLDALRWLASPRNPTG